MKNGVRIEDRALVIVANLTPAFEFYAVVLALSLLGDIFLGVSNEICIDDDGAAQAPPE